MLSKQEMDGFEKYWSRCKPGSSTVVHYASNVRIFFKSLNGRTPESISLMDRVASRPSFFMLCAVCVQIEYYNMEIIDAVDKIVTIYGTA